MAMVYRRTLADALFDIAVYVAYGLFALMCFFPFYYIVINSISNNEMVALGKVLFVPRGIHFQNYIQVLRIEGLGHAAFVSIARTVLGTLVCLYGSAVGGYAFSRPEYWHRRFWYRFMILTMYFGAGLIPWYMNMTLLGLRDNFLAYILGGLTAPFNVILVKTYIESVPASLEESAEIDGAGYTVRFLFIVTPLITPILATIAIFSAVGQWNSFMDTVLLVSNKNLYTLQYILWKYLTQAERLAMLMQNNSGAGASAAAAFKLTPVAVRLTVTCVITLPILFVYPFFQKYFVKGIMIGAIKA